MKLYEEQERICRELGNPLELAVSLSNQAELINTKINGPQEALPLAEEAYRLVTTYGFSGREEGWIRVFWGACVHVHKRCSFLRCLSLTWALGVPTD